MTNKHLHNFVSNSKSQEGQEDRPERERILVVDDDADIRELLSMALPRVGFEVITVDTGEAALETANREHFAVAIVDLNMPGLPGMETVQMLKQFDPDMEVIVFTGYPTFESSVKAIHSQVFDYICKPGDTETLQRTAQRAAERRRLVLENRKLIQELKMERNRLSEEVSAAKRAIEMPPLRQRKEDIPLLVQHFLELSAKKYGHNSITISPVAEALFFQHQWPGNVRELETAIRRIALDGNENSTLESLRIEGVQTAPRKCADVVCETEAGVIRNALTEAMWNRRKAAKDLGMSYSSLRRRIAKYSLMDQ